MSKSGEVLVAIVNNQADFTTALTNRWYRIPATSKQRWLARQWPPRWLALYQTACFGPEKYAVAYYAPVQSIRYLTRRELFPNHPLDARSHQYYYQLLLGSFERLHKPIVSQRLRRIIFIPTTWNKFYAATEINDLFDDSPLEDVLWAALKAHYIPAERQEFTTVRTQHFAPDFTVRCGKGKLAIETDGDVWHANPERATGDTERDNALKTAGWNLLRFSTKHIREGLESYCIPTIVQAINTLGGVDDGGLVARHIDLNAPKGVYQARLFED